MRITAVLAMLMMLSFYGIAVGQARVQFPPPTNGATAAPAPSVWGPAGGGGFGAPPPGAVLGGTIQPMDPYSLPSNMSSPWTLPAIGAQTVPPSSVFIPAPGYGPEVGIGPPATLSPWPGSGAPTLAPTMPPGYGGPVSPYGQPLAPLDPLQPGVTDPYRSPYAPVTTTTTTTPAAGPPYPRLFQDTGLRATYLHGDKENYLKLTEVEASTTAYFANFLGFSNGLRVTPGFAFHWTEGPKGPTMPDVPPRLYSAYLDFGLEPRFGPKTSAELSARVGVYSDFKAFDENAWRFLGTAVGVCQTTPTCALKLGVAYIDRVDLKLLPAFGVLWTPNPQTRWDIFFPAPKLSNYWTTVSNKQLWWYLGGEYGGGSWYVERVDQPPAADRFDINDVRLYGGLEWWNLNRYYAFLELGYVFRRELVFWQVPGDNTNLRETFMLRGGISW